MSGPLLCLLRENSFRDVNEQIHRARQGHVPSQAALGDLYYWGARGVPRDHVRALEYFGAASAGGDNGARCAAAVSSQRY